MDKPLFPQLFKGIALFTPGGDLIYGIDPSKQGHWHLHLCACLQELLRLPEPPHFLVPGYTATIDRWLDPRTQQLQQSAEIYQPVLRHQPLLNAVFGTGNLVWQVAPWQEGVCEPIVLETYRQQFPQLWEDHDLVVKFERTEQLSYPYSYSQSTSTPRLAHSEGVTNMELYPIGFAKEGKEDATELSNISQIQAKESELIKPIVQRNAIASRQPPELVTSPKHLGLNTSEGKPPMASPNELPQLDTNPQPGQKDSYILRLFVSGYSAATEHTLQSLHHLLEASLPYPYTLKVIDVLKHPEQAETNQISATPTLLRVWPQPVRRLVGDLTNIERVSRIFTVPED